LSPSEKSAVLAAHTSAMTQMHDAMHAMMAKMPHPQGSAGPRPRRHNHEHGKPTAGGIVLMVATGHGEHGRMPFPPPGAGMMRYHNGPGMQGPPGAPPAPAPVNT
jgi:hypothetical protein